VFLREPRDSPRKLRIQTTNAIGLDRKIGTCESRRGDQLQHRTINYWSHRLHPI
jgi:hypothetical protein